MLLAVDGVLLLGTVALAMPLGMAGAIYLSEYATQGRLTRMIRVAIVTLAGIPSVVVLGLFGLLSSCNILGLWRFNSGGQHDVERA